MNIQVELRIFGIVHDACFTTRLEHTVDLTDGLGNLWCVMNNAKGVNNIEAVIFQRQTFSITAHETSREAAEPEPLTRQSKMIFGEIKACADRAVTSKHREVGSLADTYFEHLLPGGISKAHD